MLVFRRACSARAMRSSAASLLRRAIPSPSAGAPSSRTIAQASAAYMDPPMSHTTANDMISGKKLRGWRITRVLVLVLDGDEEAFTKLWTDVWLEQQDPAPEQPQNVPALRVVREIKYNSEILAELRAIRELLETIASREDSIGSLLRPR